MMKPKVNEKSRSKKGEALDSSKKHNHLINRRDFIGTTVAGMGALWLLGADAKSTEGKESTMPVGSGDLKKPLQMRVGAGQINELTDDIITYVKELGVRDICMNVAKLPGNAQWEYEDLAALQKRFNDAGLTLASLENVPLGFYDKVMLGLPGRDEQIGHMITTIKNIGRAGVPILGYHWMPNGVWRSKELAAARGGAKATAFDLAEYENIPLTHGKVYTDQMIWDNYDYYLERILPEAEKAGVKLALHPDDPPVKSLGGIARIFRDFEGFKRAMKKFDSPYHGLDFCVGTWSEMNPENVLKAVHYFRKKIFYTHLRFVKGQAPKFCECFINEGSVDPITVVKALKEVGFDSFIIPDHVPQMVGDTGWTNRSRAYAIGYITALVDTANKS
ncbi:MAG: mannonate dehydratase [Phycisphaerae bacterium]